MNPKPMRQCIHCICGALSTATLIVLTPLIATAVAQTSPSSAIRASGFIGSIGVNIHLNYLDSPDWANVPLILRCLTYLGINQVRDGLPIPGSAPVSTYTRMMRQGIKFDLIVNGQPYDEAFTFKGLRTLAAADPNGISAIEGFNEIDNWPVTYKHETGPAAAQAAQIALYRRVRSDRALAGIPVYDLSHGGYVNLPLLGSFVERADYGTIHVYPQKGEPPASWMISALHENYKDHGPLVITEFGYYTETDSDGMHPIASGYWEGMGVGNTAQSRLILDGLLDAWQQGYAKVYVYNLFDAHRSASPEEYLGLFNFNGLPKPAATSIHNLTTILNDSDPSAMKFKLGSLIFEVTGNADNKKSILMQKSDGSFWLAVWNETGSPRDITLTFGSLASSVALFDPVVSTRPIRTATAIATFTFTLSANPLIARVILD
jgi:hypothetical protein